MRPSLSGVSAPAERGRGFRGDCGLTTLEWLLITAAVAALAALAVVLVQGQVEGTAQRLSDPDPRVAAAVHSAFEIEADARAASAGDFVTWAGWEDSYRQQCGLLAVLYADAEVQVVHNNFNRANGGTSFDAAAAGHAAAADEQPPTATKAQTQCEVG